MAFPISNAEDAAIEARIMAQQELIVAAAVRFGRNIVMVERPGRHGDCLNFLHRPDGDEHGFITNRGRFVDRQEAAKIVVASGQGSTRDFGPEYERALFTEDMWNGKEGSQHLDDRRSPPPVSSETDGGDGRKP